MDLDTNTENRGDVKVYRYRWVVLCIYCLFTISNFSQFLELSIISNILQKFYNVDALAISFTGEVFFIIYILVFLPVNYLIEKFNLRITALTCTGLTFLGSTIKVLAVSPDRFYVLLIGQTLVAIAQVYMISIPTKFASAWFGPSEISTACAIAVLGTQLGIALGGLSALMVENRSINEIENDLFNMLLYVAIFTAAVLLLVMLFFRSKPDSPPSPSQAKVRANEEKEALFPLIVKVLKNVHFLRLLFSFGIGNGIWTALGILLNPVYLIYFPNCEKDAGAVALLTIVTGGCFGSLFFGFILDKTHQFRRVGVITHLASSIGYILTMTTFIKQCKLCTYFSSPIFGFFQASTLLIGFEFINEVTYPIPEVIGCSIFNTVVAVCSVLTTLIINILLTRVDFLYIGLSIAMVLFLCSLNIYLMNPKLRRREANKTQNETVK